MVEAFANNISSTLKHHLSYTLVTPPLELAVSDSGCTSHSPLANCPCENNVAVLHVGKRVRIPNVETIVATHTALPPLPKLPLSDRKRDVFLSLQQSLLSLGQFYDADSMATLDSETVQLTKYGISILSEKRDHTNGLYFTPLQG